MNKKMYKIDITTTATLRPEILKRTLSSFRNNLFIPWIELDYQLVINVDPVGAKESYPDENKDRLYKIAKICKIYFDDRVVFNSPPKAHFARAFKWTWDHTRPDADFIFHLEDDWELLRPVDIFRMISIFTKYKYLNILRLNAFPSKELTTKNWNLMFDWNGDFFEVSPSLKGTIGFCGHPSLIDGHFVRMARLWLDGEKNPEKQMKGHHPILGAILKKGDIGIFSQPNSPPLIGDIGRDWMVKNKLRKRGNKAFFTEWEQK